MSDAAVATDEEDRSGPGFLATLPIVLWQRRWFVIIPAVLIALAAIAAAFLMPRTYRASATLLVESQDLPGTAGNVDDDPIDRRMAKIRQQILSRPDLVALIQSNDLYNASTRSQPLSALVERLRDNTSITAIDADIQRAGGRSNKGSIAFQLYFDYPRPVQAQLVAQSFVDRLLKLSATSSQIEAQTNVAFLEDQEGQLKTQLSEIEGQINHIAGVNGAALAQSSVGMMGMSSGTDYAGQIAALERQNATLREQSGSGVGVERDPNVVAAETALAVVRAQYSDNHPDVRLAETRLAAARANAKSFQARGVSTLVQQQVEANNRAIADLQRQRGAEQGRLNALAAAQSRGPQAAQEVQQLQAKADTVRANLSKVSENLLNARSLSKLADQQRGERLTLVEPPVTPDRPTSPNRPLLIAGGLAGGLFAGLVLALLVELLLRPIRDPGQLTALLGEPPLTVVPVFAHRDQGSRRRFNFGRLRLPFLRRRRQAL